MHWQAQQRRVRSGRGQRPDERAAAEHLRARRLLQGLHERLAFLHDMDGHELGTLTAGTLVVDRADREFLGLHEIGDGGALSSA